MIAINIIKILYKVIENNMFFVFLNILFSVNAINTLDTLNSGKFILI